MGTIRNSVEEAQKAYKRDNNIPRLLRKLIDIADYSVKYQRQRNYLDRAMDEFFPIEQDNEVDEI